MVISPLARVAAPPETGASSSSRPRSARRLPSVSAKAGGTVALAMSQLAGGHGRHGAVVTEQHRFRLRGVHHQRDDHVAALAEFGRIGARHTAGIGKALQHLGAQVAGVCA